MMTVLLKKMLTSKTGKQSFLTTGAILLVLFLTWGCIQNVPVNIKVTEVLPKEIAVEYLQTIPFNVGYAHCCGFSDNGLRTPNGKVTTYSTLKYWVEKIMGDYRLFITTPGGNTIFSIAAQGETVPSELKKIITALESLGIKNKNPIL